MDRNVAIPAIVERRVQLVARLRRRRFWDMSDVRVFATSLTAPAQIVLLFIIMFPLLAEVYISLTSWTPTRGGDWTQAYRFWDWGRNYVEILRDLAFWQALGRTFLIAGVAVALEFLLGLGIAFLFLDEFPGKRVFYALMLVPMMIVPAVAGYVFWLFFQSNGPLNAIISLLIGQPFTLTWLANDVTAMIAVIVAEVWEWTPLMFLIMLSGLVGLPEDQMRAATMLGATSWQKFRYLVLPMLKPIIIIALVIRGMEAVKIFDMVYLMTQGGPAQATETISIYMYKIAFQQVRWSYAAAAAMTILVIMTILASYALRPLQTPQREVA
ncbi:MAG: sugar ABC transporter permease [Anaerolineae bacterium]|nr:sugar ABC transporter permease [Anaerolineae bacterium]MDW8069976.1 sugar ABC transporter permease [Anaerolineae bacterium]